MTWLSKHWATFGGIIAICIVIWLVSNFQELVEIETLLWLHFIILLLHQFEEYKFPGGFKKFFNQNIWKQNKIVSFPLTDFGILMVNIGFAWTAYFVSAFLNIKLLWLAVGLLLISIFNGILHTIIAIIQKKYNPGLFTGVFLFIPYGLYVIFRIKPYLTDQDWSIGLLTFFLGTALIPFGIFITSQIQSENK